MIKIISFINSNLALTSKRIKIIDFNDTLETRIFYDGVIFDDNTKDKFDDFYSNFSYKGIYTILITKHPKHNKNRYNLVIKSQHIQKIQTILESKYEVFDIKKELYNAQSQLQKAKLANDVHIASLSIIKHTLSQSTLKLKEFFKDDIRKLKNILSIIENINIEDQNLRQLMIDTTQDLKNMHDNITILQFEDILIQMIDGMENLIIDQNQNLDSKAIVFDNTKISLCKEELLKFYTIQKQRDYLLGIEIADILHNDESDAITIY